MQEIIEDRGSYTDALVNALCIEAVQHRATLEIRVLGSVAANPTEFLTDAVGVSFWFEDTRAIGEMIAFHPDGDTIGFIAYGLRELGWWRQDYGSRSLSDMRRSQNWCASTLYDLFHSYPPCRPNVIKAVADLASHTRKTRLAIEHLDHATGLLEECTAAGESAAHIVRCSKVAHRAKAEIAPVFDMRLEWLVQEHLSRPRLDPLEMARELVALSRLTEIPVETLADRFEEIEQTRRVA